jgi:hypothetical protein
MSCVFFYHFTEFLGENVKWKFKLWAVMFFLWYICKLYIVFFSGLFHIRVEFLFL